MLSAPRLSCDKTISLRPLAFAATKVAAYINGTEWTVEQATDLLKVDP